MYDFIFDASIYDDFSHSITLFMMAFATLAAIRLIVCEAFSSSYCPSWKTSNKRIVEIISNQFDVYLRYTRTGSDPTTRFSGILSKASISLSSFSSLASSKSLYVSYAFDRNFKAPSTLSESMGTAYK